MIRKDKKNVSPEISDLVQIAPEDFIKPSAEAIEDNINRKYSNKVIQDIGLGICFFDLLQASDGFAGHDGTGNINVNVVFRLVVFRPFKGEIICGKVSSAWEEGMKVRLDFFDEIFVPSTMLPHGSYFDKKEQIWVWDNSGDKYHFDKNEWVRLRIQSEVWHDLAPTEPSRLGEAVAASERKSPYSIIGSMAESWLGVVSWWEDSDAAAAEES